MIGVAPAAKIPALGGWTALVQNGAELRQIEVVEWELVLEACSYRARLLPIDKYGDRLDHRADYLGLALPAESAAAARSRIQMQPRIEEPFP